MHREVLLCACSEYRVDNLHARWPGGQEILAHEFEPCFKELKSVPAVWLVRGERVALQQLVGIKPSPDAGIASGPPALLHRLYIRRDSGVKCFRLYVLLMQSVCLQFVGKTEVEFGLALVQKAIGNRLEWVDLDLVTSPAAGDHRELLKQLQNDGGALMGTYRDKGLQLTNDSERKLIESKLRLHNLPLPSCTCHLPIG
jgi:hypothetical protein